MTIHQVLDLSWNFGDLHSKPSDICDHCNASLGNETFRLGASQFSDDAVRLVADNCPLLQEVSFAYHEHITVSGMKYVPKHTHTDNEVCPPPHTHTDTHTCTLLVCLPVFVFGVALEDGDVSALDQPYPHAHMLAPTTANPCTYACTVQCLSGICYTSARTYAR